MPIAQNASLTGGTGARPDAGASMAAFRKVSLSLRLGHQGYNTLVSRMKADQTS